ncbi:protein tesmin/TSO1-like CXC 4 isoform X2 [Bombus pyrosoma]|nr:protein tesmin/TSO1-like CXC 4 isoform X2 [Bombus pyrosoma]XP_043592767.1 protein tesmin/TSO1-like CXC 4 isoform X2 [Bombus pyrosoma]
MQNPRIKNTKTTVIAETTNSQQQNDAAQITNHDIPDESPQSLSQSQSVADLDTEISTHTCICKDGCSTRQCDCVNREIRCGQRCECRDYGCQNQEETAISEEQSNAAQVTDESPQSLSQNRSVADLDTEIPTHKCGCKKGCSTKVCKCVKREIRCGQRCECRDYGCQNQD